MLLHFLFKVMAMVMAVLHGGAAEQVSKGSVAAAAGGAAFSDCKMLYAMIKEIHDVALQFDSGSIREEAAELVRERIDRKTAEVDKVIQDGKEMMDKKTAEVDKALQVLQEVGQSTHRLNSDAQ